MAYINVSSPTGRAVLQISTATIASTSSGVIVAALQDITVNNAMGTFNWTQLDESSQLTVATPATNSIAGNIVVDPTTFFAATTGLFALSNNATLVYFRVYFNGNVGAGKQYIEGRGYITNLAPTVNPTAPVWVTPIQISVDGPLAASTT
jgi:hypothetical protein